MHFLLRVPSRLEPQAHEVDCDNPDSLGTWAKDVGGKVLDKGIVKLIYHLFAIELTTSFPIPTASWRLLRFGWDLSGEMLCREWYS